TEGGTTTLPMMRPVFGGLSSGPDGDGRDGATLPGGSGGAGFEGSPDVSAVVSGETGGFPGPASGGCARRRPRKSSAAAPARAIRIGTDFERDVIVLFYSTTFRGWRS